MNERKLVKLNKKAEKCLTREKAQKILRKYEKATAATHKPLGGHHSLV